MIRRKIPWTKQPQYPARIDWTNQLLEDVDFVLLGSERFYNPKNKTVTNSGTIEYSYISECKTSVFSKTKYLTYPNSSATGGTGGWTIAGIFMVPVAPTSGAFDTKWSIAGLCESPNSTSFDRSIVLHDLATDKWSAYIYDGALKYADGPDVIAGKTETLVATCNGSSLILSAKGFGEKITAVSNSGYNGYTSAEFCIGNSDSSTAEFDTKIPLLIRCSKFWDEQKRKKFIDNPWQIFEPQTRNIYLPSAGGTQYNQAVAGTLSFAGVAYKSTSKQSAGTLSASGATAKAISKPVDGTLSLSGVLQTVRAVLKAVGGTLSFTSGTVSIVTNKAVAGTVSFSGAVIKSIARAIAGTLSMSGVLSASRVIIKAIDGTLSFSGTVIKSTAKGIAGTFSATGAVIKSTLKSIAGSLSFVGALVALLNGITNEITHAVYKAARFTVSTASKVAKFTVNKAKNIRF